MGWISAMSASMRQCAPLLVGRRCALGRTQVRANMRIGGMGDWRARRLNADASRRLPLLLDLMEAGVGSDPKVTLGIAAIGNRIAKKGGVW